MIINNDDAEKRLNSPLNLINRLKTASVSSRKAKEAMSIFIKPPTVIQPTNQIESNQIESNQTNQVELNKEQTSEASLSSILENHESQIKLGLAHDSALKLLNRSVDMLYNKLDDVNASKLPSVIAAASKTVESIRRERLEQHRMTKGNDVHYHFYTPEQKKISDYEIIEVA